MLEAQGENINKSGLIGNIFILSSDVRMLCVCAIAKTRFPVDWRLLVKERIANIGTPVDVFGFLLLQYFLMFRFFACFGVFVNQPTVHNVGLSRGRVCGGCCWR